MGEPKTTVRYLGYRTLADGGRGFDFSFASTGATPTTITIDAAHGFFEGPERIAIQEATAICYETLKSRVADVPEIPPEHFKLTAADVARHRKQSRVAGRTY
jgi:hypothetical protein